MTKKEKRGIIIKIKYFYRKGVVSAYLRYKVNTPGRAPGFISNDETYLSETGELPFLFSFVPT